MHPGGGIMPEPTDDKTHSYFENVLSELVRKAVRATIKEIVRPTRDEGRLLTVEQVAERLSVSNDWIYRNGKKVTFTKNSGQK